jgi:teichuronic acid biosynthesis glycosyltransferase TuaH
LSMADRHLIWMAGVSWDGIRGTDRHLVTAMTEHARILWVDPPVSPVTPAKPSGAYRSVTPRLMSIDDRITRLAPVALPGLTQVRWAIRRLSIVPYAVVATYLEDYLGYWGRGVVNVLYGTDDYVAGAKLMGLSADHLVRQERRAVTRADVVAAVSPQLADKWQQLGVTPVVIPNGCWLAPARAAQDALDIPHLPGPVVGLVGQLSERIDIGILEAIADAGLSLLIVGPVDFRWEPRRFAALTTRAQVHYAGAVSAEAVPSYLARMDVGITPYQDSKFNRASFPLKTLEYLGAGLPVISTDLPAGRWLLADLASGPYGATADEIFTLADREDFPTAIRHIAGRGGAMAERRVAFAATHTWSRRAEVFTTVIGLGSRAGDGQDAIASHWSREDEIEPDPAS